MKSIRITALPPGDAPEEIREAWIDLTLPLPDGLIGKRRNWYPTGVFSRPKSAFAYRMAILFGRLKKVNGYYVNGEAAITELEKKNPTAAAWWRQNSPQFLKPSAGFIFSADVCEVQNNDETGTKRPFQFTIRSLMIITAAVGGYFAMVAQAPVMVTVKVSIALIHISLLVLALLNRKYWTGLTAINFWVFSFIGFPMILFTLMGFTKLGKEQHQAIFFILCIASTFGSLAFAFVPFFSGEWFNKIFGLICLGLNVVWIVSLMLLWSIASVY